MDFREIKSKGKVLFSPNNGRVQTFLAVMANFNEFINQMQCNVNHSALIDYFLFLNLKKSLGRGRFSSNNEMIAKETSYFDELGKS